MADSKVLVNGSAYKVSGGQALVSGTGRKIKEGKTLVSSSGKSVKFENSVVVFDTQGYYFPAYNFKVTGNGRSLYGELQVGYQFSLSETSSPTYWENGSGIGYKFFGTKGPYTFQSEGQGVGFKVDVTNYSSIKVYSEELSGTNALYTYLLLSRVTNGNSWPSGVSFKDIPYAWDAAKGTYCGTYNVSNISGELYIGVHYNYIYQSSAYFETLTIYCSGLELVP